MNKSVIIVRHTLFDHFLSEKENLMFKFYTTKMMGLHGTKGGKYFQLCVGIKRGNPILSKSRGGEWGDPMTYVSTFELFD